MATHPKRPKDDLDSELPLLIADPFRALSKERHPFVWLWNACDAVESLLKFLVVVEISERSAGGALPPKLAETIRPKIDRPSMGQWGAMLRELSEVKAPSKLVPELPRLAELIGHLLSGHDPAPKDPSESFQALRNQLAHGGVRQHAKLRSIWKPRLAELKAALSPLQDLLLVARDAEGAWIVLRGGRTVPFTRDIGLFQQPPTSGGEAGLYAVRGDAVAALWPLSQFEAPLGLDDRRETQRAVQFYLRRENDDLHYLPLQIEMPLVCKAGREALDAFLALFPASALQKTRVADFNREIHDDAAERVGRDHELNHLVEWVEQPNPERKGRGLWVEGVAGMGKSVLVAALVTALPERPVGRDSLVLPYRFRVGDLRCNWATFCTYLDERLPGQDSEPFSTHNRDQAKNRVRERVYRASSRRPVILVLDGIDEIHRADPNFVHDFLRPLATVIGLTLVCAGRPDHGLPELFHDLPAESAFPEGLAPMKQDEVRAILLERLERPSLRKRLIEQGERDGDAFVSAVEAHSQGLPLYVRYVVNDILGGKFRVMDARDARELPPSLTKYYQRLVSGYQLGTGENLRIQIAYILAIVHQPLDAAALAAFCLALDLIAGEGSAAQAEDRVRQALSALGPVVRMAPGKSGTDGFVLYHDSFRRHLRTDPETRDSVGGMQRRFGKLALEWKRGDKGPVAEYLVRYGVEHLLETGDKTAAEQRLLDIPYMAALCRALESFVVPLGYWREIGLDRAEVGYPGPLEQCGENLVYDVARVGSFLLEAGLYQAAEPLLMHALEARERTLGPDHPETLKSLNNLGVLLCAKGNYAAAEPLNRRALEAQERTLGPDHPETLRSLNNLGALLYAKGNYAAAEPLYRRALEAQERTLGPNHPHTLAFLSNLGVLLSDLGNYAAAEPLYRRALEAQERTLGPDHPDTLRSLNNLGALLSDLGNYAAAEPLYRRALEAREGTLGPDHPDTLSSLYNLGALLYAKGDYEAAEPLYRRALEARERTLGPDHPDTLRSLNFLGNLLQAKGDYNAAEPLYRRALEARERTNGPGRPETLDVLTGDVLTGLIILLDRTNRSQEASDLLRAKAVLSDKARAAVLYRWACSECLLGNLERARELIAEDISLHPNNLSPAIEDDDLQAIRPILESLRASAVQDAENQEIE